MGGPSVEMRVSDRIIIDSIQDIDTVVERLNNAASLLLFPQKEEFDISLLKEKYNFPDEDYKAMEEQEEIDFYDEF